MRHLVALGFLGIVIVVSCGGKAVPDDAGSGGSGSGTGGTGGATLGGTGGATVGGTGGGAGTTGTGGSGGSVDPGPEFSSCTGPGECTLVPTKCCSCDTLGLDLVAAINTTKTDAYRRQVCGVPPIACPPCVGSIDPHLVARCEAGRCRGFDVRTDPTYTGCATNDQCILRKGLACCECQATGEWVALNGTGSKKIVNDVCAPNTACPGCVPVPPPMTTAVCRAGICERTP
jgi:hypothetical protein